MAKTKPIGVRFDEDLIKIFQENGISQTPQGILNYLTEEYLKLIRPIVFVSPTPEVYDSPKMENITHDEPPIYRVGGVFIPETPTAEKIDYRIKVQPLIVKIDPELEKQIPREVLIEISKKCPYKNGIKRTEHIQKEKCDWLAKNKLKNNQ